MEWSSDTTLEDFRQRAERSADTDTGGWAKWAGSSEAIHTRRLYRPHSIGVAGQHGTSVSSAEHIYCSLHLVK
jgi:hypothetical protein